MNEQNFWWWKGVIYTDGWIRKNKPSVSLSVGPSSKEMIDKWADIGGNIVNSTIKVRKRIRNDSYGKIKYESTVGIKKMIDAVDKNIDYKDVLTKDEKIQGAWLAGVIDGDGSIWQKKNRKNEWYLQFKEKEDLLNVIIGMFNNNELSLKSKSRKVNNENCHRLTVYLSKKRKEWLKKYVLPHIAISKKYANIKIATS